MKIKELTLRSYKRFVDEKVFVFDDSLTIITGNNGHGKSSILQAIVSLIATATGDIDSPSALQWGGFKYNLLQSGKLPILIKASVQFDEDELSSTVSLFNQLDRLKEISAPPSKKHTVSIRLDYDKNIVQAGSASQYFQFSGYAYAKQLASLNPIKSYFDSVGSIFWYTEKRDNYSFKKLTSNSEDSEDTLRKFLTSRYNFSKREKNPNQKNESDIRDLYRELADSYGKIFSPRRLLGPSPRLNPAEAFEPDWFYLSDGHGQYEVSEMSAGERAIFPLLIDFANFQINNSIIIIDELELHLHPPLQQAFFRSLPYLGTNNQFIVTTHSDYIVTLADSATIIRL